MQPGGTLSRRAFIGGGLALSAGLVVGCGQRPPNTSATAGQPSTVKSLLTGSPFYIAHRGGGDNWPEMTSYAYRLATALPGLQAIEISVCLSSDGVLVCSHDPNTLRMTGANYNIAQQPWSVLQPLMVTSAYTLDPTQPARPFTRLSDVLPLYIDRFVVFIEPKTPQAVAPLMKTLVDLKQPSRTVWKQPINQLQNFTVAKSHGFSTWGYVLDEPGHLDARLSAFAASPEIDLLGAPRAKSASFVKDVVANANANNKLTIMWDIRTAADRDRAMRLGCTGMMTSNIAEVPYVEPTAPVQSVAPATPKPSPSTTPGRQNPAGTAAPGTARNSAGPSAGQPTQAARRPTSSGRPVTPRPTPTTR